MESKTFLRLTILVCGFVLLLGIFIMLIAPMMGLLFLAVSALVFTILWTCWPRLRNTVGGKVSQMRQDVKKKVSDATKSEITEYDVNFHPNFQLVFNRHGRNNKTVIDKEVFVIGRSASCDLVIADPTVSGKHCRIVFRKYSQSYYIEDLSSNNGTFLGVRRLEPFTQEKLLENASITVADRTYRFTRIS